MIIGHYIHHLEGQGGVEVYLRRIAGAQQAAGHTVYYFSKYTSPSDHNSAIAAETEASLYEQAKRLGVELLHLHASVSLAPPEDFVTIRTMHGHQAYCPSGSKYLKRQGTPCDRAYSLQGCLWGHLIDHCGSIRPHRLAENFQTLCNEKRILAKIPVLTNSEFVTEHMIAEGYPPHLIHTLYVCATEVAHVQEPPQIGIPHFAFLGRLVPEKGVVWLLRALAQVNVPVHLDIAGVGNQTATLQTMIQQLGLADRVTLHGWLNMEASYQLIQRSRALIFPSVWHEPAGLVAYEAMLNARATIASRVGGIPEGVLDGVTGLLVEPNDIAGLANHIERLATDWALAKQLGENGRRMAQQSFGLQNHMQKLMQFYEQVMRSSKDQPLGLSNCS